MSNRRDDAWTAPWVAEQLSGHSDVIDVTVGQNQLRIKRRDFADLDVGTLAVARLDEPAIDTFLGQVSSISFLANVRKDSYTTGDALSRAERAGIGLGGLGDLKRVIGQPDPSTYRSAEFTFVERGLSQHTRVAGAVRLDDRRYLIRRHGLDEVRVVFLNHYELTADGVRTAIERYGAFQAIVKTNPNGGVSSSAEQAAASAGRRILRWGDFLGALNKPWT